MEIELKIIAFIGFTVVNCELNLNHNHHNNSMANYKTNLKFNLKHLNS